MAGGCSCWYIRHKAAFSSTCSQVFSYCSLANDWSLLVVLVTRLTTLHDSVLRGSTQEKDAWTFCYSKDDWMIFMWRWGRYLSTVLSSLSTIIEEEQERAVVMTERKDAQTQSINFNYYLTSSSPRRYNACQIETTLKIILPWRTPYPRQRTRLIRIDPSTAISQL